MMEERPPTIHQFPPKVIRSDGSRAQAATDNVGDVGAALQALLDACDPGDCVYLNPGTYILSEPLRLTKNVFLMGFDDSDGRAVVLKYDGGRLAPSLSALRVVNGARVSLTHIHIQYTHDVHSTDGALAAATYALSVLEGGSLELKGSRVVSTVGGVDVRYGASFSAADTDLSTACTAVDCAGTAHYGKGVIAGCTVGLRAAAPTSLVSIDQTTITDCGIGIVIEEIADMQMSNCQVKRCKIGCAVRSTGSRADPAVLSSSTFESCARGVVLQGLGCNPRLSKCIFAACATTGLCVEAGTPDVQGCSFVACGVGFEILGGEGLINECVVEGFYDVGVIISGPNAMPRIKKCVIRSDESEENALSRRGHASGGPVFDSLIEQARRVLPEEDQLALPAASSSIGLVIEERAAPHVLSCNFERNGINIWSCDGCGILEGNTFGVTEFDSIVAFGAGCDMTIDSNDIDGTQRGTGIGIFNGATAVVRRNLITNAQLAGVTLRSAANVQVVDNEVTNCQDAIVAMGTSTGAAKRNATSLRTIVFSDAEQSFTADAS
jgi:nitrous oxidase accessory protein NosD